MGSAQEILRNGAKTIDDRAAQRDMPNGERSMARAVAAFNGLVGGDRRLTETEGWLFMTCLKAARATAGTTNMDDYVDGAAYFALAGECAARGDPKEPVEEPGGWTHLSEVDGKLWRGWDPRRAAGPDCGPRGKVAEALRRDGTVLTGDSITDWGCFGLSGSEIVGYRLEGDT